MVSPQKQIFPEGEPEFAAGLFQVHKDIVRLASCFRPGASTNFAVELGRTITENSQWVRQPWAKRSSQQDRFTQPMHRFWGDDI